MKRIPTGRIWSVSRAVGATLRLAQECAPGALRSTLFLAVFGALIPPGLVWFGKHLVDLVVANAGAGSAALPDLIPTIVALGLGSALYRGVIGVQGHRQTLLATAVEIQAERRFLEAVVRADLARLEDPDWHDRAARAARDMRWRPYNLAFNVITAAASAVGMTGMVALLATLSPLLAGLAVVALVPSALVDRRLNRELHDFWTEGTTRERERDYLGELLTKGWAAKDVRAFGLAPHLLARHGRVSSERLTAMQGLYRRADRKVFTSATAGGLALGAAYLVVADKGLAGELTPGDLTIVVGAFAAVTGQIASFIRSLIEIDKSAVFLDDYFGFLAIGTDLPVQDPPVPLPGRGRIAFQDVTFRYPGAPAPSLVGINLQVEPGQVVALVGPNGAGKTTLLKLLLRLYDPDEGSITVGGVDVRAVDAADLRDRIGVLFQDFTRYELTLRDNVAFGRVDREPTDAAATAALDAAGAGALARRGPRGLDANVGRLFEGAKDLSGGEWQRVALARLLFRDADIVVMDEPTAALDADGEEAVFAELRQIVGDRIAILVSHRFSTVRAADQIAVMEDGRITEMGTHDELVQLGGTYARLYELQAVRYR